MAKSNLYNVEVTEVTFDGNTKQGNGRYLIAVVKDDLSTATRRTKGNCSVNYDAKTLKEGDVVDLITDGRGSVIVIEVKS